MNKGKKLNFEVENISVEDSMPNSKFAKISLDFFASGDNEHEMYVSEDVLNKKAETIFNVPIVWEYDRILDDAGSHDPLEVPCGFVKDDAEIERIVISDGRTMLRVVGYIWKRYSGRLMEILERDGGKKPVSVEMSVYETHIDDDGKESLIDYVFEAITILGSFIQPAIPSAGLSVLSFSQEKSDYEKAYKKEFAKYSEIDFSIPLEVKANCQDGLDIYNEFGYGGTTVSLAMSRYIIKNDKIEASKIRKMAKYFTVNGGRSKPDDINGREFISWQLYGGEIGKSWSSEIVDKMNVADEAMVSHFNIDVDGKDKNFQEKEISMKKEEDFKKEDKEPEDEPVTMEKEEVSESEDAEEKDMAKEEDAESEEDFTEEVEEDEKEEGFEAEEEKDYESLFTELEGKFSVIEVENKELRKFKSGIERQQFDVRVETTLTSVKHLFDKGGLLELREDAKNYSLDSLNGWENVVKAKAFEVSEKMPKDKDVAEDDGILKMSLVDGGIVTKPVYDSLWD